MKNLVLLLCLLAPSPALACGGLFCSAGGGGGLVDQAGEQIIFEVGDGTVCAHVTIDYVGDADEFAWIVPVPGEPEIAETDPEFFADLGALTAPRVVLPQPDDEWCPNRFGGSPGGGCCNDDGAASSGDAQGEGLGAPPVLVLARTQTENYEAVTLAAQSAADLVDWLRTHAYNVSDNMIPAMQPYLDDDMNFVAVRLREGRAAERIRPLVMCYAGQAPSVPLRLTAVAAQPLMGIQVIIMADHFYVPHEVAAVDVDLPAIGFDANGVINYGAWMARVVDEAEGRAFVTEFRGDNPLAGTSRTSSFRECIVDDDCPGTSCVVSEGSVLGLCARAPVPIGHQRRFAKISRYSTRLSPHQMTFDPVFVAAPEAPAVDGTIDLSDHPSPQTCAGFFTERLANECAFEYCGAGATCVIDRAESASERPVGCVCPAGTVAQGLTDGTGTPRVTCVPRSSPFAVQDDVLDEDPCDTLPCGAGTCSLRGGFRACACDAGAMAHVSSRGVMCSETSRDAAEFGPGGGVEAQPTPQAIASVPRRQSNLWVGVFFVLCVVGVRWRLRRV